MSHNRNQSVGTAATLFGDSSSSADFFSSLQDDPIPEHSQDNSSHFSETVNPQSEDLAELFPSSNTTEGLWSQEGAGSDAGQTWPVDTSKQTHEHPVLANGTYNHNAAEGYTESYPSDYANQGWYDEYGQWHEYSEVQHPGQEWSHDASHGNNGTDTAYSQASYDYDYSNYDSTATYNAAASTTSAYTPAAATSAYPATSEVSTHSNYDPYQPVTTSYAPMTVSTSSVQSDSSVYPNGTGTHPAYAATFSTQSTYDPYKPDAHPKVPPPTKSSVAPTAPASQSYPYSISQSTIASKPTQSAATVYNRNTGYSAYDPPLPTSSRKGSKSLASPPTIHNHPAQSPGQYSGYTSQTPPAIAPPPPHSPYIPQSAPSNGSYTNGLSHPPPPAPYAQPVVAHSTGSSVRSAGRAPYPPYNPPAVNQRTSSYESPVLNRSELPAGQPSNAGHSYYGLNGDAQSAGYNYEPVEPETTAGGNFSYAQGPSRQFSLNEHHLQGVPEQRPLGEFDAGVGAQFSPPNATSSPSRSNRSMSPRRSVDIPVTRGSQPASPEYVGLGIGSPPMRHTSPPYKAPPRTTTPGSIRSNMASPDSIGRASMSAARASPRPDAHQARKGSVASNPAAHLEAARSRIASPEVGTKAPSASKMSPPNGTTSTYDPYRPSRTTSLPSMDATIPSYAVSDSIPAPDTYTPLPVDEAPARSSYDAYAPSKPAARRQTTEPMDYAQSSLRYDGPNNSFSTYAPPAPIADTYVPRMSSESTRSAYAPSTTQTGRDDLLSRTNSKAPLFSFGFGGKVVSCFPVTADVTAGFDVSMISKKPPAVSVRLLRDIVSDAPKFPGPLFCDPGTPTVNITKTTASAVKAKKASVIKYLEERVEEAEKSIGQLAPTERSKESGRLCLLLMLRVMVENDGKLMGSTEAEKAIRIALVPRLKSAVDATTLGFVAPGSDGSLNATQPGYGLAASHTPLATYSVYPEALQKIQEHLLVGNRKMAYRHALDEKLWAHAMLIASSMDKDAWKEVASEFIKTELSAEVSKGLVGCEPMRVAYGLFAGQGYAAVEEMLPSKPLIRPFGSASSLLAAPAIPASPMPPNSPALGGHDMHAHADVPIETLAKWRETAATIASNASNGDHAALTGLGDLLLTNKWTHAAHTCYLLSSQSSAVNGIGTPSAKIVILGAENPSSHNYGDPDPLIFTEILEFAMSLVPVSKGQEAFGGIPHLQAYRLIHAFQLAELGHVTMATRYCDAITATLRMSKPSPYFTATFQEALRDLVDRLSGTPQLDKSGSWIARKMTKPSLATIGNWIESGVAKFVAGEGESSGPASATSTENKESAGEETAGPFAQFSVIASRNNSPNASTTNLAAAVPPPPMGLAPPPSLSIPRRSGSALAIRQNTNSPIDRAASAMDVRTNGYTSAYSAPQIFSANAATTTFYQTDPFGKEASNGSSFSVPATAPLQPAAPYTANWWGATDDNTNDDAAKTTPTTFYSAESNVEDTGNFVTPMDSLGPPLSQNVSLHSTPRSVSVAPVEEEEEDLGFGNSTRSKKKSMDDEDSKEEAGKEEMASRKPAAASTSTPQKPAETPRSASGSWLPWRWGGKKEETPSPGPVKAKLGKESSFYYDKELKRWVNKEASDDGSTATAPALPPPPSRAPSRAQTASPGVSSITAPPPPLSRGVTPPPRPQTSHAALTTTMKAIPPRRSHLAESFVPTPDATSAPATPGPLSTPKIQDPDLVPPPASVRSSAAAKRKGKNRYVDVFAQEQGST